MPHFIPQRSPRPAIHAIGRKNTVDSADPPPKVATGGTTAARLSRQMLAQLQVQLQRHNSSPSMLQEDPHKHSFDDGFSLKSFSAWSAFGDLDTERERKASASGAQGPKNDGSGATSPTIHMFVGKLMHTDMFNVFLSLAKDGANGAMPVAGGAANNKDQLAAAVYKQFRAKKRLMEPYKRLREAVKHMQQEYLESKAQNLLMRYQHMQKMIHEVILLEHHQWQLIVDIPSQAISETPQEYVMRVSNMLDEQEKEPLTPASARPGGAIAQLLGSTICIAERTKDSSLLNTMRNKSVESLREECAQLSTELYRLIHKYQALRLAVRELSRAYQHTRFYPLVPRYNLLKAMIKRILRTVSAENEANGM